MPIFIKGTGSHDKFGYSKFCIDRDGNLKKGHRYFSQIQLQIEVARMTQYDLVIYTGVADKLYITLVTKDEDFCRDMVNKCTLFFNHVMPELMSRRVDKSLGKPSELRGISFCGKPPKGRMVTCSEAACCIKQFHPACVGLTRKPK